MKRILSLLFVAFLLFLMPGCNSNDNGEKEINIPSKNNANDTSALTSPINTTNLDQYLFREDVQYVDLRSPKMIMNEGHIAGFEFIPFYSIIASFNDDNTLYKMQHVYNDGQTIPAGQVGGFVKQYEESENIINSLFSKEKYIFLVSQGGSEASYTINLLIQLGYCGNLLYNIGGVMNSEGIASYSSIKTNKYFISGHGDLNISFKYEFMNDLTPVTNY